MDWLKEDLGDAKSSVEALLDEVSVSEDIEDEEHRGLLLVSLEDAYEALTEAVRHANRRD